MPTSISKGLPEDLHRATLVFAALGNAIRQEIIMLPKPGEELSIKEIADQFDLGRTTIVHHLTVLHNNGVLRMRKNGRQTIYSVAYDSILDALRQMHLHIRDGLEKPEGENALT
ncbi:MAG: GntR family transcriptional regulator [Desulfovibrionaceae bacterium]|nr:GntR family transcriptional regulator [Desulfovibrionaceae bacterium]